MNNLKKNRLNKLNKLLMEQQRPPSMRRAAARRSRGDTKQSPQSVNKSSLLDKTLDTATTLLTLKGGKEVLEKALGKAGAKVGKDQIKKSFLRRIIQSLGPRALIAFAGEIAAFQALSAEAGILATAGAAGAGLTTAAVGAAILAGTAAGTAIGYGLNKALNAADLEGEVAERISKARKSLDYAKAELDIYCQGRGPLCGDEVKCSGKSGGYVYDIAGEEGMYGLGRGAGRELFGVPGFRKFKQLAHQFHSNDGAMMIGLAAALASHDLKNDKIVLPNKENKLKVAKFKPGAASKQYEKCIKKWITGSKVMINSVGKLGLGDAYESLRLVYGLKAFPVDLPDKKPGASPTPDSGKGPRKCDNYPITKGCVGDPVGNLIYIAVGGTKSGPDMGADSKNEFNQAEVEKLIDAGVLNDKVIKLVSQILKAEGASDVLNTWKTNNYTIKSGDKVDRWFDVTASRKGMTENLDFYRKLKKSKSDKLANILMEGIK